jgi:hypothetical protein
MAKMRGKAPAPDLSRQAGNRMGGRLVRLKDGRASEVAP